MCYLSITVEQLKSWKNGKWKDVLLKADDDDDDDDDSDDDVKLKFINPNYFE